LALSLNPAKCISLPRQIRMPVKNCLAGLLLAMLFLTACDTSQQPLPPPVSKTVTDALGRSISVPGQANNVITMRAGALRLMLYMGLADKVGFIEKNDLARVVPYMMAHPELKQRPVIGVSNNFDPEAVAVSGTSLIVGTYMSEEEADDWTIKTGKPVFCLAYGDLYHLKTDFYKSLTALGQLFDRAQRADSLIAYIETTISEVGKRAKRSQRRGHSAYIGGIAFNGVQGIASTRAQYPPFVYLGIDSPADALPHSIESIGMGQKNMLIDMEQLISWDTDYLFLDASGQPAWSEEINKPVLARLRAKKLQQTYVLLPFNWHTINYEHLLCNMWFVGKTVYPDTFSDVNVEQKCREIFTMFYGRDIYDEVKATYQPFEKPNPDARR